LSKFWDFDKVYDAKAIFRLFGQPPIRKSEYLLGYLV